jgi:hypothetical protein
MQALFIGDFRYWEEKEEQSGHEKSGWKNNEEYSAGDDP